MEDETIDRLIGEMATFKQPFVFSPFKVNEPFLDTRLRSICESFLSRCQQGSLRLFTNGSALLPSYCRWIADLARVHHLWVSLNSMDSAEHQALMKYPHRLFLRIRRHLDVLHDMVEKGEFGHEVIVSRVSQENAGDLIFMKAVQHRWPLFKPFLVKKTSWLGAIPISASAIPQAPCTRWYELSICADGRAALCCMDGKGDYELGSIHAQSLLEIYNSPGWRPRREFLLNRHTVPICKTCTYG